MARGKEKEYLHLFPSQEKYFFILEFKEVSAGPAVRISVVKRVKCCLYKNQIFLNNNQCEGEGPVGPLIQCC